MTTHDFRDFEKPIEIFRRRLHEIGQDYQDVEIIYSTATEAVKGYLGLSHEKIEDYFESTVSPTPGGKIVRIKTKDHIEHSDSTFPSNKKQRMDITIGIILMFKDHFTNGPMYLMNKPLNLTIYI